MKKENKKKVVTLSAMAALLAVVLGMGGKTYAKYFTSNTTDAQTATVAKWGLVLNQKVAGEKIFATSYDTTVASSTSNNVAAPGTSGKTDYVVAGSAEVDAKVTFAFNSYDPIELIGDGTNGTDDKQYYPIVWSYTIDGVKTTIGSDPTTVSTWTYVHSYEANTNTDGTAPFEITISWEWAFGAEDNAESGNDKYDTLLGQAAYAGSDTTSISNYTCDLTLSFQLSATIVQVN